MPMNDNLLRFLMWPWSDQVINGILIKNKRTPMAARVAYGNRERNTKDRNRFNKKPDNPFIALPVKNPGANKPMLIQKVYNDFQYENGGKPSIVQTLMKPKFIKAAP